MTPASTAADPRPILERASTKRRIAALQEYRAAVFAAAETDIDLSEREAEKIADLCETLNLDVGNFHLDVMAVKSYREQSTAEELGAEIASLQAESETIRNRMRELKAESDKLINRECTINGKPQWDGKPGCGGLIEQLRTVRRIAATFTAPCNPRLYSDDLVMAASDLREPWDYLQCEQAANESISPGMGGMRPYTALEIRIRELRTGK